MKGEIACFVIFQVFAKANDLSFFFVTLYLLYYWILFGHMWITKAEKGKWKGERCYRDKLYFKGLLAQINFGV